MMHGCQEAVTAYRVGHLTFDYYIKDYVMIIVLWYIVSGVFILVIVDRQMTINI